MCARLYFRYSLNIDAQNIPSNLEINIFFPKYIFDIILVLFKDLRIPIEVQSNIIADCQKSSKSNRKIEERRKIDIHIYMTAHFPGLKQALQ